MRYARLTAMVLILLAGIVGVIAYNGDSAEAGSKFDLEVTLGHIFEDVPRDECLLGANVTWKSKVRSLRARWDSDNNVGAPRLVIELTSPGKSGFAPGYAVPLEPTDEWFLEVTAF